MSNPQLNPAQKALLERKDNMIKDIMGDLSTIAKTDRFRMQEEIFVNVFLPLFAGEKVIDPRINLGMWVNQVGNPYREVDVVDTGGKVLFTVPAISNRETVRTASAGDKNNFHDIITTTQQIANNAPAQAQEILLGMMMSKNLLQYDTEEGIEEARRWNEIFARYGRPSPFDLPAAAGAANASHAFVGSMSENGFEDD